MKRSAIAWPPADETDHRHERAEVPEPADDEMRRVRAATDGERRHADERPAPPAQVGHASGTPSSAGREYQGESRAGQTASS